MEKDTTRKTVDREKVILIVSIVLLVAILFLLWAPFDRYKIKTTQQQSYSELINTKEIATLSVSEFIYNGIAQSLKENGDPDYNVLYKSTVKVSVDASNIDLDIDEEKKAVRFTFHEFKIESPIVDVDSFSFIPSKKNLYMNDVVALCKKDALNEAQKSETLISSAQENLKSIIEAWYSPVLDGYSFEYSFDPLEGGESK